MSENTKKTLVTCAGIFSVTAIACVAIIGIRDITIVTILKGA